MSEKPNETKTGIVYVKRIDGHRRSYQDLFARHFALRAVEGSLNGKKVRQLIASPRLIFSTVDDDYFGFLLVAAVRAVLGRRTVAIFLRPVQCFETGRFYYPIKRVTFRLIKFLPGLSLLTIIPFDIRPELSKVANGWIHDPQFWDMQQESGGRLPNTSLQLNIQDRAAGRKILSFIGVGSAIKGLTFLADVIRRHPELGDRLLVVVAGEVEESCSNDARDLEAAGMLVVNRFVSDEEIMTCYGISDLIWCCYRPDYDQASGIFGRAAQVGRRSIVRAGSIPHAYDGYLKIAPVAVEFGDTEGAARKIESALANGQIDIDPPSALLSSWRDEFQQKIASVL